MNTLNEIIKLIRFVAIPFGTTFRVVFCFIKMIYDEEAINAYKKKIINIIAFFIISELIFVISDLVKFYFGEFYH